MSRPTVAIIALVFGIGIGGATGWCAGRLHAAYQMADRQYDRDCQLAWPVIKRDQAFNELGCSLYPTLGFCLFGEVPTSADYDRLRVEMTRLFGEPRIDHIMNDVTIRPVPTQPPPK